MTRIINSDYRDRCRSDRPDPYPVHVLKRVDHPTTKINEDDIQRKDERRSGFHRAGLGEFGERLQKEYKRFVPKHPLSGALVTMAGALGHMVDAPTFSSNESDTPWGCSSWTPMKPIAGHQAPITDDPKARAHHAMNYQVMVPPILLWAGLGEMCRIGDVVLNPFLGPRFKAAVVTTDLPLAVDKPIDFGLQDFCDKCGKCAEHCPSQAISHGDKIMYNGYQKWDNSVERCTAMRVGNQQGSGCGTCIKVCPWNKPYTPFHRTISWTMRNIPPLRRAGIWADDVFGYGKENEKQKWWLDLERVNGVLQVPQHSKSNNIFNDLKN